MRIIFKPLLAFLFLVFVSVMIMGTITIVFNSLKKRSSVTDLSTKEGCVVYQIDEPTWATNHYSITLNCDGTIDRHFVYEVDVKNLNVGDTIKIK